MPRIINVALLFTTLSLFASPAQARDATDRTLLATFCDAANIKGDTCKRAKGYPAGGKRECEVKLLGDRFSGKFIASGNPRLVVNYDSGCESRANDDGGAVVFELVGGKTSFVGFHCNFNRGWGFSSKRTTGTAMRRSNGLDDKGA